MSREFGNPPRLDQVQEEEKVVENELSIESMSSMSDDSESGNTDQTVE